MEGPLQLERAFYVEQPGVLFVPVTCLASGLKCEYYPVMDVMLKILVWFMLLQPSLATATVVRSADEETGLVKWHFTSDDLEIELIQRLPDQTRGFFLARGFSSEVTDEIATSCVLQTIVRNRGLAGAGVPIVIDLGQWRMVQAGRSGGIRLKEAWIASWPEDRVSEAARLAFRWATFPTTQEFLPGDYNWGMTAYGLPPGAVFDLNVVWQQGGQTQDGWIRGIECPADVDSLK